jgi:hypothetical protein
LSLQESKIKVEEDEDDEVISDGSNFCGSSCSLSHPLNSPCRICSQVFYNHHMQHNCASGERGSFLLSRSFSFNAKSLARLRSEAKDAAGHKFSEMSSNYAGAFTYLQLESNKSTNISSHSENYVTRLIARLSSHYQALTTQMARKMMTLMFPHLQSIGIDPLIWQYKMLKTMTLNRLPSALAIQQIISKIESRLHNSFSNPPSEQDIALLNVDKLTTLGSTAQSSDTNPALELLYSFVERVGAAISLMSLSSTDLGAASPRFPKQLLLKVHEETTNSLKSLLRLLGQDLNFCLDQQSTTNKQNSTKGSVSTLQRTLTLCLLLAESLLLGPSGATLNQLSSGQALLPQLEALVQSDSCLPSLRARLLTLFSRSYVNKYIMLRSKPHLEESKEASRTTETANSLVSAGFVSWCFAVLRALDNKSSVNPGTFIRSRTVQSLSELVCCAELLALESGNSAFKQSDIQIKLKVDSSVLTSGGVSDVSAASAAELWHCPRCTLMNEPAAARCIACDGASPNEQRRVDAERARANEVSHPAKSTATSPGRALLFPGSDRLAKLTQTLKHCRSVFRPDSLVLEEDVGESEVDLAIIAMVDSVVTSRQTLAPALNILKVQDLGWEAASLYEEGSVALSENAKRESWTKTKRQLDSIATEALVMFVSKFPAATATSLSPPTAATPDPTAATPENLTSSPVDDQVTATLIKLGTGNYGLSVKERDNNVM